MFIQKDFYEVEDLILIMDRLRGENGCPWDIEQTHQSIRNNFIEETYEAVEAIDLGNAEMLREELGDVLLQVVFHCHISRENGGFNIDQVADGICKKLILRHPHIFGDVEVGSSEEVLSNWETIKQKEKGQKSGADTVKAVPKVFPALMRAQKVQKRAAKTGFDYPDLQMAIADLESELEELKRAIKHQDEQNIQEELGDLIFSCVNVARFVHTDAEEALTVSTEKFIQRFVQVEELASEQGIQMKDQDIDQLNELWKEVKRRKIHEIR